MTISIDLGSGPNPRNQFNANTCLGIDPAPSIKNDNVIKCWVGFEPIPLDDSTIDYITAYDFVEHVPRVIWKDGKIENPFINMMNEVYRILKPGGRFYAHTPAYPHPEAFQDPTHVNIITDKTIGYFNGTICDHKGNQYGKRYGFNGKFKGKQSWDRAWLVWDLIKV